MTLVIWQLIDSGFPAGGFAHSGGLEAAIQHGWIASADDVCSFARQALSHAGRSALPFVTAARGDLDALPWLDHQSEIFLTSSVANRASRAQGRALLTSAVRSFPGVGVERIEASIRRDRLLAHYAPVFGAIFGALGVDPIETQRAFLFMTVRGIASAGVRLGAIGGYDAQRIQMALSADIERTIARCGGLAPADASQTAPLIDVFQSAHDRLYSRLFQS